jgi:methylmalonyl-CoA/ethylmalonyl-CoA epimerase
MLNRLHHIGFVVSDIAAALARHGAAGNPVVERPAPRYRIAYVDFGGTRFELVEPLSKDSIAGRFLTANPDGGMYHLAYEVDDLDAAARHLIAQGAVLLGDGKPRLEPDGTPILVLDARKSHATLIELRGPLPPGR